MAGLSAVMGSWKITAIFFPRNEERTSSVGLTVRSSLPINSLERKISPEGKVKFFVGSKPSNDIAVTDFPLPDSPTTAVIFPGKSA